jgi:hypothetical protein
MLVSMNDESRQEPMMVLKLGDTRLYIGPCLPPEPTGTYQLEASGGTVVAGPFTRDDASQFVRELREWIRSAELANEAGYRRVAQHHDAAVGRPR